MRKLFIVTTALAVTLAFAPPAGANEFNTTISHLTFSGPIRFPGVTLPAGTYTFQRVTPRIIEVLSQDRMTLYGVFMTIPALRSERTTKDVVVLGEAVAGEVPPLNVWYRFPEFSWNSAFGILSGEGYAFLYPKEVNPIASVASR